MYFLCLLLLKASLIYSLPSTHESSSAASSSLPALDNSNYTDMGKVVMLGDLPVYVVGNNFTGKAIIWNYDIFGFDSGRTRQLADIFAEYGYYLVIIPDYYRGTWISPGSPGTKEFIRDQTNWEGKLRGDWEKKTLPYLKSLGIKKMGTIGTCWGSYMAIRLSLYDDVVAGVSIHPAHSTIMSLLEEDEEVILDQLAKTETPQLIMPSKTDSFNVKSGGLNEQVLGKNLATIVEFPDMSHGWTSRGDMKDPVVARDVRKAIGLAIGFFIGTL